MIAVDILVSSGFRYFASVENIGKTGVRDASACLAICSDYDGTHFAMCRLAS